MVQLSISRKLLKAIFPGLIASLSTISLTLGTKPSLAAERISFSLPILGEFNLSVNSLEIFAKEGKVTKDFQFYAKHLDEQTLAQLRRALQHEFKMETTAIYKLTNAPIGEKFLKQLGQAIYTHPERNGFYAIRASILLAASDPEGLTVINVLRHFPTKEIQVNSELIFDFIKETANFLAYNESTVEAIAQIADSEAISRKKIDFAPEQHDLRQQGNYAVRKKTISFEIDRVRQTKIGFADSYELYADIYLPEDQTEPAPLAIITHGFGSSGSHFQYLAEHLASYGYIVLVPEHIGSNSEYKRDFLSGRLSVDVSPIEFYSRPLDVTYLLDEIEKSPEFQALINWEQVGILGHSFGGNTALAIAGAPINQKRINQVCQQNRPSINISMLLQCRASGLPPGNSYQRDPRIKAVVAANPVTSTALGPESMGKIDIPTMLLAGSKDTTTPFITEQAHPFLWLKTQHKYLGVMAGGTHGYLLNKKESDDFSAVFRNPHPQLRRNYLQAMSLAFFEVYLRDNSDYQPYLSSTYAKSISEPKLPLHLIQSLTPEKLEQAYGKKPPTSPIPEILVVSSPTKEEKVIAQIKQTKILRVAMRSNAAPFGYIDSQEKLWQGYCDDFADSLGEFLAQELNIDSGIEVIKLPSDLKNRFDLVAQNTVHLECGPNTVREDIRGISFSNPFFISGTRFLVTKDKAAQIDLGSSLRGIKTGVLRNSTTEEFVQKTYPQAEVITFQGDKGGTEGIQAIIDGSIDLFVSDGVLLSGELKRQDLTLENYELIPKNPLTCDFYGLILPEGEKQWNDLVNAFIVSQQEKEINNKWLEKYSAQALFDADYCLNRKQN